MQNWKGIAALDQKQLQQCSPMRRRDPSPQPLASSQIATLTGRVHQELCRSDSDLLDEQAWMPITVTHAIMVTVMARLDNEECGIALT
jgi:hypothetical protein